ncbi:hypothetical protein Mtc_2390 [Methanocella conradii HZ254]|uniref:Uncharacterized protein n=1 Tax=Methanocella conradii (strain DSM 24694 / JCM 17849 / CGMCC 1.5162 / HZ254) TaxID=1041930 RepID=H8I6C3_METCZ|nr:hypothetical protein Mtc_2390 [Methanocella conradii HZ254]
MIELEIGILIGIVLMFCLMVHKEIHNASITLTNMYYELVCYGRRR